MTQDINDMRAVINTSALILEEEGTKTIEDIKRQMVLMEDEAIPNFLMEINKYKRMNVQTLSQVTGHRFRIQWKMKKHMRKHKVKLTMSQEKPPPQVLLPRIPPLAQKLLQKKLSPYPYGNPLRTNLLMNVFQTSDVKVTASIQPVAKLNLKIRGSLK